MVLAGVVHDMFVARRDPPRSGRTENGDGPIQAPDARIGQASSLPGR